MQKREKIMLAGVGASLLVVVALQFLAPTDQSPGVAQKGKGISSEEVKKTLDQSKLTQDQLYRIRLLADNATADPFYGGKAVLAQDDGRGLVPGEAAAPLVYSGFIKVGPKVLAVINGIEYAVGDELAEGGYSLKAIDKHFVVLERTDGSTGRRLSRRVPLAEDDTDKIRIRVVKRR
jgi:hypothetical protein